MGEFNFADTSEVAIPKDFLEQIIGQPEAVRLARLAAIQRRHLLLVGPPGTGKSMIAQAIASLLGKPNFEVAVLHNPAKPERPFVEVKPRSELEEQKKVETEGGEKMPVWQAPHFVSERLGYRCRRCGKLSDPEKQACTSCGADKFRLPAGPFDDLLYAMGAGMREDEVYTTRVMGNKEELMIFERVDKDTVRAIDEGAYSKMHKKDGKAQRNIILPIERKMFVQATGASETELLGDVRHDPYGSHPQIGSLPYTRVVPGAVHEAHEGVLFIDELLALGHLQRNLLTAMQDRQFPITGRNASSTGAAVRVDSVPCDFILVASCNINDLASLLPPLRNRIAGNGYELLVNTTMDDTEANRLAIAQFVSQEIRRDGRIPHATSEAVEELVKEAAARAKSIDNASGLTLRLRALSGIVKMAGDFAKADGSKLIERKHVEMAKVSGKPAEEQIAKRYGSTFRATSADAGISNKQQGRESEVG